MAFEYKRKNENKWLFEYPKKKERNKWLLSNV
jgi:hypothetical protein